ncbi:MAG: L,D-transpeptidase [Xanthobacteraceae bacterium]
MSSNKISRRVVSRRVGGAMLCAAVCAALATILSGPASAQALSYLPADGNDGAILRESVPQAEQPLDVPAALRRQVVAYAGDEPAGTIIIDTPHAFLYLTLGNGKAIRYGIGVGREGFTWSGVETISRKSEWPDWIPPAEMVARQPYLPRWVGGGPGNPLGARALYLGNTAYRIHGTNNPASIGKHVSSGCIRLRDEDVIDLYDRVGIGTKVVVLPNDQRDVQRDIQRDLAIGNQRAVPLGDQHRVSIEGGHGAPMTAQIFVRPAADLPQPRAALNANPALSGLY